MLIELSVKLGHAVELWLQRIFQQNSIKTLGGREISLNKQCFRVLEESSIRSVVWNGACSTVLTLLDATICISVLKGTVHTKWKLCYHFTLMLLQTHDFCWILINVLIAIFHKITMNWPWSFKLQKECRSTIKCRCVLYLKFSEANVDQKTLFTENLEPLPLRSLTRSWENYIHCMADFSFELDLYWLIWFTKPVCTIL